LSKVPQQALSDIVKAVLAADNGGFPKLGELAIEVARRAVPMANSAELTSIAWRLSQDLDGPPYSARYLRNLLEMMDDPIVSFAGPGAHREDAIKALATNLPLCADMACGWLATSDLDLAAPYEDLVTTAFREATGTGGTSSYSVRARADDIMRVAIFKDPLSAEVSITDTWRRAWQKLDWHVPEKFCRIHISTFSMPARRPGGGSARALGYRPMLRSFTFRSICSFSRCAVKPKLS
jgi:hypothetical protein